MVPLRYRQKLRQLYIFRIFSFALNHALQWWLAFLGVFKNMTIAMGLIGNILGGLLGIVATLTQKETNGYVTFFGYLLRKIV